MFPLRNDSTARRHDSILNTLGRGKRPPSALTRRVVRSARCHPCTFRGGKAKRCRNESLGNEGPASRQRLLPATGLARAAPPVCSRNSEQRYGYVYEQPILSGCYAYRDVTLSY